MSETSAQATPLQAGDRRLEPVNASMTLSKKDAARREIRRSIITGSLQPGERLTEHQLADSLKVSRPTVREALNELADEGLVTRSPHRGVKVSALHPATFHDIALGRIALDMVAVDAILSDESGERFERVERCWRQYEIEAFDPDPVVQHDAHLAFHQGIWEASENYLLTKLWPVTAAQITIALAEDQRRRSDPEREHRVHSALMDALRTGDRRVIERRISLHILTSAERIAKFMAEKGRPSTGGAGGIDRAAAGQLPSTSR
ncbi:GntR family transcriptional regulator [Leucobacter sp. CSA1]|uniref:GntR family transcriptional regulator n=1 Tax=Leucobacter chromiisoli TaxID=2796471 RepID=A0A934Q982_9MICO|nr:GntR family transcriptional regulator [Leucobacter chromiisoli]MBK0418974.1 GntR family transcriptional regulator [Leucobacter chromiisoli]